MTIENKLCIIWGLAIGNLTRGFIMKQIVARIVAWFGGDIIQKIIKCLPEIVVEVEKAMADGKITASERKALAMKMVDIVAEKFNIKVSGLMKWVISIIIDSIAKKLPSKDIKIPDIMVTVSKEW